MTLEPFGTRIRRQRRRLGLTLDDLAGRTGISKPYLSLIETGRVPNPPSDEKVCKLEQALSFKSGDLLSQAHLLRTPKDVRAMLNELVQEKSRDPNPAHAAVVSQGSMGLHEATALVPVKPHDKSSPTKSSKTSSAPSSASLSIDLLRELVDRRAGNVQRIGTNTVPVINRVSAGYPKDFTDLSYPKGVADTYLSCPDVADPEAFAARVSGDSMTPKYREGDIVIFSPKAAVIEGADCFVRFDDGHTTFKRVFFESDDKGHATLRLQPRNERYRPQVIDSERITGLYRAVFKYQSVDD